MPESETSVTLQQLLHEIKTSRNEILSRINTSEAKLLMKVESVDNRVIELEKENSLLKIELEKLERKSKENSILIFGLNVHEENFTLENICQQFQTLLKISVNESDINNFYKLGKTANSPIKVEFLSYLKKQDILRNCHTLKGKNISIVSDKTQQQRDEYSVLRRHLLIARKDKNNCYIKNNILFVNGSAYSVQDLTQLEIEEEQSNNPNSTHSTATTNNRAGEEDLIVINPSPKNSFQGSVGDISKRNTRQNQQRQHTQVSQGKKNKS